MVAKTPRAITQGSPVSQTHKVVNRELGEWMEQIELQIATSGVAAYFEDTLTNLNAVSAPATGSTGFVLDDGANSGVYLRGASSWTKTAELPLGFEDFTAAIDEAVANDGYVSGYNGDLDDLVTPGKYALTSGFTNGPTSFLDATGLLIVENFNNFLVQRIRRIGNIPTEHSRTSVSGNASWSNWTSETDFYIGSFAGDLNSLIAPGDYVLTAGFTNGPSTFTDTSAFLQVRSLGPNYVFQTIRRIGGVPTELTRNSQFGKVAWTSWGSATVYNDGFVGGYAGDLNTLLVAGQYILTTGFTNGPADFGQATGYMKVSDYGNYATQTVRTLNDPFAEYTRNSNFGKTSWLGWKDKSFTPGTGYVTKKIVFLGDSIMEGYNIPSKVAALLGLGTVVNGAFGGSRLTNTLAVDTGLYGVAGTDVADAIEADDWTDFLAQVDRRTTQTPSDNNRPQADALAALDWTTVDYVICSWGTNDWFGNVSLGTTADDNNTTIYGAAAYVTRKIITAYPNVRLLWLTPIFRQNWQAGDGNHSDIFDNGIDVYLYELGDAIISQVRNKYRQPVFDMYRNGGINTINAGVFLSDGIHPSAAGQDALAGLIAAQIELAFGPR